MPITDTFIFAFKIVCGYSTYIIIKIFSNTLIAAQKQYMATAMRDLSSPW